MADREAQARARYVALLQRAAFDVRLALDLNLALGLPYRRRARLLRVQKELRDEARDSGSQAQPARAAGVSDNHLRTVPR